MPSGWRCLTAQVGRAMADLQRLGGQFDPPQEQGEFSLLQGAAPVATLRDYRPGGDGLHRRTGPLFLHFAGL